MAIEDTLRALSAGEVVALAGDSTFVYANRHYEKNVTTGEETLSYWFGDKLVAVKKAGTLSYVHQDHLGSTALVTDTAGNTTSSLSYLPFGGTRVSSGLLPTDRRFTGQRLDNPVNLYFYNARYYDAELGRFVSGDTVVPDPANPQDLNRFSSSKTGFTGGMTVRDWLSTQSYEQQRQFGLEIINRILQGVPLP